jgi:hypothetical protein
MRELGEPRFDPVGQRRGLDRIGRHRAPDVAIDDDRGAGARADPGPAGSVGDRAGYFGEVVDFRRATRVNFYRRGDLLRAVNALNGITYGTEGLKRRAVAHAIAMSRRCLGESDSMVRRAARISSSAPRRLAQLRHDVRVGRERHRRVVPALGGDIDDRVAPRFDVG